MREELWFAVANRHFFDTGNDDNMSVNSVCTAGELEGALAALWFYRATTGLECVHFKSDKLRLIDAIENDNATKGLVLKGFLVNLGTDMYEKGPYQTTDKGEVAYAEIRTAS